MESGVVKKLLAADLWPMLTTEDGETRLQRFQSRLIAPLDRLLESLVLYDEVVIPTQDFLVVPALTNALGEESVRQLLDSGAVRFLRIKKQFAFVPGRGASVVMVAKPSGEMLPYAKELDELMEWIANDCIGTSDPKSFLALLSSITTELDAEEFTSVIRDESESDVQDSARIREIFELPHANPRNLPAPQNNIFMYGGPDMESKNKQIQSYLRLVQSNVEVAIAARQECDDISTATALDTILAEKFNRSAHSDAASELFNLSNVPDFSPLVRTGQLPLQDLIALRNSSDGEQFRKWFHESLKSGDSIAKEYVNLIQRVAPIDSIPAKVVRIIVWTSLSTAAGSAAGPIGTAVGAGVGLAGSLIDTFALNRLRVGGSAKLFLESLAETTTNSDPES